MPTTHYIQDLAAVFSRIKNEEMAENILRNILTPKELEEISKRLQIFKMLKAGTSQREIAKKLKVSIGTVSRGSRELQYGPPGFKNLII
jgi:TrpR family trp operon transcriptional repressor